MTLLVDLLFTLEATQVRQKHHRCIFSLVFLKLSKYLSNLSRICFFIFAHVHVHVFFHSFSMLLPTRRSIYLSDAQSLQKHPKSEKRPDLRGDITSRDGKQWIFCKGCKKETSYGGWSTHCLIHQSKVNGKVNAHVGDKKDDDRSRSKPRPKAKAGAKKAGGLKNGPAAKKKTSPRGS